jgi:anti-anti-sigma factor
MRIRIEVVRYEDEGLVWLAGALDVHTADDVRGRLWRLLIEGVTDIVVDASRLLSMDRIGLDVLDAVSHLVVERQGRFVVCSPSPAIGDFLTRAPIPATITIIR